MEPAGGDGVERSAERAPVVVVAPAGYGGVGLEPTRIKRAGGDSAERSVGRVDLSDAVVAPAGDGGVGSEPAREVFLTLRDRLRVFSSRIGGCAVVVVWSC